MESGGFDVDLFTQPFGGIVPTGRNDYHTLFGKVGLHCYNMDKGTDLQFKTVQKVNVSLFNFYITLEAIDPVDNSVVTFQTCVTDAVLKKKARLRIYTRTCRIKPQVPGTGETCFRWYPDDDVDDDLYKCDLPDWLRGDELIGGNKLQFYEVKECELKDNRWLYLYAEFALFSEWEEEDCDLSKYLPFEMEKVVVQTREDVESLKSRNAIFYMSFKTRYGIQCRGIVRKASDGKPEHMCLETRCWVEK